MVEGSLDREIFLENARVSHRREIAFPLRHAAKNEDTTFCVDSRHLIRPSGRQCDDISNDGIRRGVFETHLRESTVVPLNRRLHVDQIHTVAFRGDRHRDTVRYIARAWRIRGKRHDSTTSRLPLSLQRELDFVVFGAVVAGGTRETHEVDRVAGADEDPPRPRGGDAFNRSG